MDTRLPVFQMVLWLNSSNEYVLKFSEEVEGFSTPVYTIPYEFKQKKWWRFDFFLPGEINEQYFEFKIDKKRKLLSVADNEIAIPIDFQVRKLGSEFHTFSNDKRFKRTLNLLRYEGKYEQFIYPFIEFLIIDPQDIKSLNTLYAEQKTCLVGVTPTYGKFSNSPYL